MSDNGEILRKAAVPNPAPTSVAAASPSPSPSPASPASEAPSPARAPAADPAGAPGAPGKLRPRVVVRPVAGPARVKRRHWGLILGFVLIVLIPMLGTVAYLWGVARDQYASTVGFTVRHEEETSGAADLLGGLRQFTGGGGASDADILYEFIQSQVIVERLLKRLDLRKIFSRHWPEDPAFSLWPDASIEDLVWFWRRMVRISYDQSSGLIELRALGPTPEEAQQIAEAVVAESQEMINELNATARADSTRYARADLDQALERLKIARKALTEFRTRTRIVDPAADIQGRMGVLNTLQQQLAEALIEYDLLAEQAGPDDPRLKPAQKKIDVIRARIASERDSFTLEGDADYPVLMAEYEGLTVDREFAERTYTTALAALDLALSNATRQTRYIAAYVRPTLAQTAAFPRRLTLATLMALFLVLTWAILALIYYSLRDRR